VYVDIFLCSFENRDVLYELNVKCDYARKCRRKFHRKFHGNAVPKTTGIHTLIKRVTTTGLLLDSKAAIMHSMLTEEKLDEIGVPLEHTAQWVSGVKARPGRDADHSPPSSAEVENEEELYSSPPKRLHGV
jgi:hypothetical protein